ncbi:uncharacterized protein UTRI_00058_B [Ustilago trichophora]|uniref:Uncharacterized protein n=1 Tax=Ustilago trichophora TaxID=86804 RepID=A0A5C3DNG7_9BASI|nr:uncharacterized protein UTRI_00058_B [Ustilago trichophora]
MPLLRLQTKSGNVDDGVPLTACGSEPLTFRAPRTSESMNRPKPFLQLALSSAILTVRNVDHEQRDIWMSPEPEFENSVSDAPAQLQSQNFPMSSSAIPRGILKNSTSNLRQPRENLGGGERRVRFSDDVLFTGKFTDAPSTPRHPSLFSNEEADGELVRVKMEDTSLDIILEDVAESDGEVVAASSSNFLVGMVKNEPIPLNLSEDILAVPQMPIERLYVKATMPDPETSQQPGLTLLGQKRNEPLTRAQPKLNRQLRASLFLRPECRKHSMHICRVLYGHKRHSFRRDRRRTTGSSMRVKRGSLRRGRCAVAVCASRQSFILKILQLRLGQGKKVSVKARTAVRRFVRAARRYQRRPIHADARVEAAPPVPAIVAAVLEVPSIVVDAPTEVPSIVANAPTEVPSIVVTAPAIPSIVITTEDIATAQAEARIPVLPAYATYSTQHLREFLKHALQMVRRCDPLFHFPPYQLLTSLRSVAHCLLQQAAPLRESRAQWRTLHQESFKRFRDLLKDIIALTAIIKLDPSSVVFEAWQDARTISLRRLASVKRLLHRTLSAGPTAVASDLLSPATPRQT